MLPKDLVRIIHEMIPVTQVDEIAQIINYIMFTQDQLKFYHWSEAFPGGARPEGYCTDCEELHHIQMHIATLGGTNGYDFGVFVDKPNLYFQNDRRTIVGIFSGLTENNWQVDTKNNYKLPIREHIYSIANVISEEIDYFKELYERQVISEGIDYFCKKFSTIPVVEYCCERRPLDDEITFEQLGEIFSP